MLRAIRGLAIDDRKFRPARIPRPILLHLSPNQLADPGRLVMANWRTAIRKFPPLRQITLRKRIRQRKRRKDIAWEYAQTVLIAVGNMTIMWAGIELMLDHLIGWYQGKVGAVIRKTLPRQLNEKLDYLSKMEPDIRFSAEERNELKSIRLELFRLSEFRHDLIHGLLYQKNNRSTDWTVHRLEIKRSGASLREINYSNDDIQQGVRAIFDVSHRASPFFRQLMGW